MRTDSPRRLRSWNRRGGKTLKSAPPLNAKPESGPIPRPSVKATAARLVILGLWIVAIHPNEKRPIGEGWGLTKKDIGELNRLLDLFPGAGLGVGLGPGRGPDGLWLIDIEGDGPLAEESFLRLVGEEVISTMGWKSRRGRHRLFVVDGERLLELLGKAGASQESGLSSGVFKLASLPGLEFRVGGRLAGNVAKQLQSVCPPTATDGVAREWEGGDSIAELPEAAYEALEGIAERLAIQAADSEPANHEGNGEADHDAWEMRVPEHPGYRTMTLHQRVVLYLAEVEPAISGQGGHKTTIRAAAYPVRFGIDEPDEVFRLLWDHYNSRCQPPWSEKELRHKAEEACRLEKRRDLVNLDFPSGSKSDGQAGGKVKASENLDVTLSRYPRTDLGNAERLIARHGRSLRYCHPWSKWMVWDGKRWKVDDTATVRRCAKNTVRKILREASNVANNVKREGAGEVGEK